MYVCCFVVKQKSAYEVRISDWRSDVCSSDRRLQTPPPVNSFWSVTLYDEKTFALHPDPLCRYLVSDRTKGLKVRKDGSIEIRIQHAASSDGNWLPAPAGPFFVVIRAYGPTPDMLNGQWLPPPLSRECDVR